MENLRFGVWWVAKNNTKEITAHYCYITGLGERKKAEIKTAHYDLDLQVFCTSIKGVLQALRAHSELV